MLSDIDKTIVPSTDFIYDKFEKNIDILLI